MEPHPDFSIKKDLTPEELLSSLRTKLDLVVTEYGKRLKVGVQEEFTRRVAQITTQLDDASKKAVEQYDKEMKKLEKYKSDPTLFAMASKSVKDQLEITLKIYQQLLGQFITNCKDLIS